MADTVEQVKQVDALAAEAAKNSTPITPKQTSQVTAINDMYDAQKKAQLGQLESAYNINKSNAEAERAKIGLNYQTSANDLAAQYERNKRNFNQQAVSTGINTGTASQAELAQNAAYQRDYGRLRTAEAQADTEAGRQMQNLEQQYQASVADAIAKNDYSRAAALLDEYNNQYTRDLDQAKILAGYGDFSGYVPLYGQEVADGMEKMWYAQNRDLAYQMGRITADQRDNLAAGRPINDGLNAQGIRIVPLVTASSGGSDAWNWGYNDGSYKGGNAAATKAAAQAAVNTAAQVSPTYYAAKPAAQATYIANAAATAYKAAGGR